MTNTPEYHGRGGRDFNSEDPETTAFPPQNPGWSQHPGGSPPGQHNYPSGEDSMGQNPFTYPAGQPQPPTQPVDWGESTYYGPPPANPPRPAQASARQTKNTILGVILMIFLIIALGLVVFFTFMRWGVGSSNSSSSVAQSEPASEPAKQQQNQPSPTAAPPSTTTLDAPSSTQMSSTEAETSTETSRTSSTEALIDKPMELPDSAVLCSRPRGLVAYSGTEVTSCEFAQTVAREFTPATKHSDRTVTATSPVTGLSYEMKCGAVAGGWRCTGGDNAVVFVELP